MPKGFDDFYQQHQFQTLLEADQLYDNVKKTLATLFCANTTAKNKINTIIEEIDRIAENNKNIVDVEDY